MYHEVFQLGISIVGVTSFWIQAERLVCGVNWRVEFTRPVKIPYSLDMEAKWTRHVVTPANQGKAKGERIASDRIKTTKIRFRPGKRRYSICSRNIFTFISVRTNYLHYMISHQLPQVLQDLLYHSVIKKAYIDVTGLEIS